MLAPDISALLVEHKFIRATWRSAPALYSFSSCPQLIMHPDWINGWETFTQSSSLRSDCARERTNTRTKWRKEGRGEEGIRQTAVVSFPLGSIPEIGQKSNRRRRECRRCRSSPTWNPTNLQRNVGDWHGRAGPRKEGRKPRDDTTEQKNSPDVYSVAAYRGTDFPEFPRLT